jgi:hypothetical protein
VSADFNPNSTDAVLSRILQRMDGQDVMLREIRDGVTKTNGRVTSLEREKWYQRGITVTIAALAGGAWEYWKAKQ